VAGKNTDSPSARNGKTGATETRSMANTINGAPDDHNASKT
jgi:hypothetical protein